MPRPTSIVLFERLYLSSLGLWAVNTLAFWSANRAVMESSPAYASNDQIRAFVGPVMIGSAVLVLVVSILLWWLVTRGRSVVGKWLVVATEAVGALGLLLTLSRLATRTVPNPGFVLIGIVVTALALAAAAMLFRPDARLWFGELPDIDEDADLPPAPLA